jgi:hypothetical protein
MLKRIVFSLAVLLVAWPLAAQSTPGTSRIGGQVGFGFSAARPDISNTAIKGIAFYGNVDVFKHFGIAAEINDLKLFTPRDIGEATYLYGVRYQVAKDRFHPYAKGLFGLGTVQYQPGYNPNPTSLHFTTYAIGGGVDITAARHLNIRLIDLEYQFMPSFSPHGLTPFAGTIGAAYRF